MNAKWRLAALVLFMAIAAGRSAEPAGRARASLATKGDIWVGQRVTLVVELLSPTFFDGSPDFDLPRLPGVLILKPEDRAVVGSEQVEGMTYSVQRHEFAVFAEREGVIAIPAFAVRFSSSTGVGQPPVETRAHTTPVRFEAQMPPDAAGLATIVTTRSLTATERWTPEPQQARIGDAFRRVTTLEARDFPAMLLPTTPVEPIAGLRAYAGTPSVTDRTERGDLIGRRVETVTYVCQTPGTVEIPERTLTWWDPEARQFQHVRLPGRTFDVAPAAAETPSAAPPPARRSWSWWVLVGLVLLGLARWRPWRAAWRRARTADAQSEAGCFRRFRQACRDGDAQAIDHALRAWLDCLRGSGGAAEVETFAARSGNAELIAQLNGLQTCCYGSGQRSPHWSAAELGRLVACERRRWRQRPRPCTNRGALAPLNPT